MSHEHYIYGPHFGWLRWQVIQSYLTKGRLYQHIPGKLDKPFSYTIYLKQSILFIDLRHKLQVIDLRTISENHVALAFSISHNKNC